MVANGDVATASLCHNNHASNHVSNAKLPTKERNDLLPSFQVVIKRSTSPLGLWT